MRRMATPLALVVLLLAVQALAMVFRERALDGATVGSDALGQFLAARSAGWTNLPRPPNPEGGHALWLMVWPLVPVADSLEELFRLRFAVGALVAPLAALSAWLLADRGPGRWAAAAAAGLLLALDPGLPDTLQVAFRGYGAPELLGLATLGLAISLRGHTRGALVVVIGLIGASGQHPMATGAALGALFCLPWLGRRWAVVALAGGAVVALPRLWHLARLARCGEGPVACLGRVASGSSEPDLGAFDMLGRAFHDRLIMDLGLAWPLLFLALIPLLWRQRALLAWAVAALLGVVLLGLAVDSLRPYHLRVVAVPLGVAAAVGAARVWPLAVVLAGVFAWQWWPARFPSEERGQVALADRLGAELAQLDGPLRVDGVWFERPIGLDPAAVVLAADLQGAAHFSVGPDARVALVLSGWSGPAPYLIGEAELIDSDEGWALIALPSMDAARAWRAQQRVEPVRVGGAFDWLKALHPSGADIRATDW